jgi:hypothetical protein
LPYAFNNPLRLKGTTRTKQQLASVLAGVVFAAMNPESSQPEIRNQLSFTGTCQYVVVV